MWSRPTRLVENGIKIGAAARDSQRQRPRGMGWVVRRVAPKGRQRRLRPPVPKILHAISPKRRGCSSPGFARSTLDFSVVGFRLPTSLRISKSAAFSRLPEPCCPGFAFLGGLLPRWGRLRAACLVRRLRPLLIGRLLFAALRSGDALIRMLHGFAFESLRLVRRRRTRKKSRDGLLNLLVQRPISSENSAGHPGRRSKGEVMRPELREGVCPQFRIFNILELKVPAAVKVPLAL